MFKKRPAGWYRDRHGKTQYAPAESQDPAPTRAAATSSKSPVRTRTDAKAESAYAIVTVLESRLQSPFG